MERHGRVLQGHAMSKVADPGRPRHVFCNRTLNMRSVRAIGFDMDYTLVHYDERAWEQEAYKHVRDKLLALGLPVSELRFDPELFTRGLILDTQLGNVVKANRFGYVTRASHGTELLAHEAQRAAYERTWVDLSDKRWVFLNTLFSLSEACVYGQLVDLLDAGRLPSIRGYDQLYALVRDTMNSAHLEGELKALIARDPDRFVILDPELALALLDLRNAGKALVLITNSEYDYSRAMMSYTLDRFLPEGMTWRDLFEIVIVQAGKPGFFERPAPMYEVVDERGLLKPHFGALKSGGVYFGGHARLVEQQLGLTGNELLYVGDHVYADVHVSSQILRWRTALILRELEVELAADDAFAAEARVLTTLMAEKELCEREQAQLRLSLQRDDSGYAEPLIAVGEAQRRLSALRDQMAQLDVRIAPLAKRASELSNQRWGPLMRAGADKSRLARQIERYADVYTSRVSNFLYLTPFGYLRAPRGSLPHDL
jgi:5'-nucleotidase